MKQIVKAHPVFDCMYGRVPLVIFATEDRGLIVATDALHKEQLAAGRRMLDREGWLEKFSKPENHPFYPEYTGQQFVA